jgi:chloramphenicol O-acetyltransferase
MSSLIKKKIKKKKKKKQDNSKEIVPQRHEREGNLNYYSEEIAKIMIEKIISLALTRTITQSVEKKFDKFCIDLATKTINNLVEMSYINKDKDDFDVDNIDIKSYIKYNKTDMSSKRDKSKIHSEAWET